MKFWNRLRWVASILFIAALSLSWWGFDSSPHLNGKPSTELRVAPVFTH